MPTETPSLNCPLCGQSHSPPALQPGQRAKCVRCDTIMAEGGRLGQRGALVFAVTGLVLAIPALTVPWVTLSKFGNERSVNLADTFVGYWSQGFEPFGALVLFCGAIAPFGMLALLIAVTMTDGKENLRELNGRLSAWAQRVEFWAMPEVQVLGVLVAFFKLGSVVDVSVRPGLYAYAATSLFTLLAWRSFKLQPCEKRARKAQASAS